MSSIYQFLLRGKYKGKSANYKDKLYSYKRDVLVGRTDRCYTGITRRRTIMIYTALTKKAMKVAYEAHHGQTDRSGVPYIFHPVHVAEQMDDEISTCVALLHDVVEDTEITFEDLSGEFPEEVIEALRFLTRDKSVNYFEYIRILRKNPIARKVKEADIRHNSDISRLENCDDVSGEQITRLKGRYTRALEILHESV